MEFDVQNSAVTYQCDKHTGPPAGRETADALEFLARLTSRFSDKSHVLQRYYGFYFSRQSAKRCETKGDGIVQSLEIVETESYAMQRDAGQSCSVGFSKSCPLGVPGGAI
jgi:hypothetical protein